MECRARKAWNAHLSLVSSINGTGLAKQVPHSAKYVLNCS
jgi:hypothetical protein